MRIVGLALLLAIQPCGLKAQAEEHPAHRVLALGDLRLESGDTLRGASLLYVTYGSLNQARNNAILLPTPFLGTHHSYDRFIGPGEPLDTDQYYVVVADQFGSGGSSSPSNAAAGQAGGRFPLVSIRDNVTAQHRLVTEELGLSQLRAVIGISMGAQQAFQWAVSYPDFMELVVPVAGTAKTHPHALVRLESALALISGDPSIVAGDDTLSTAGKDAWALHWLAWVYSPEWWQRELFKNDEHPTVADVVRDAASLFPTAAPRDYLSQGLAWKNHDVGATPGFNGDLEVALASIRAQVLYMPSATDMYFPPAVAEYEARFIPHCTLLTIPTVWGHLGTGRDPQDAAFVGGAIREALSRLKDAR